MENPEKNRRLLENCYDENGLLLRYPGKKILRGPVLTKLAGCFDQARTYTEKEVNQIILNNIAFSDVELIRRELIEGQ